MKLCLRMPQHMSECTTYRFALNTQANKSLNLSLTERKGEIKSHNLTCSKTSYSVKNKYVKT